MLERLTNTLFLLAVGQGFNLMLAEEAGSQEVVIALDKPLLLGTQLSLTSYRRVHLHTTALEALKHCPVPKSRLMPLWETDNPTLKLPEHTLSSLSSPALWLVSRLQPLRQGPPWTKGGGITLEYKVLLASHSLCEPQLQPFPQKKLL